MIDLHAHILPGIDDGPPDASGSLRLCKGLADDGVEVVAATPHLRFDHPAVRPGELAARSAQLNARVSEAGIRLRVVPAAEADLTWVLEASDDDLRLASYGQNGAYLLLETPYAPLSANFEQLIFQALTVRGYEVVLAHPERNRTFQRDPGRLGDLARRGVIVQITALALLRDDRRSRSGRLARALLTEGIAHLLASDAHSHDSRRGPNLAAAVRVAARIAPARARWMVTDAPGAILAGEPLPPPPSERPAGRVRRRSRAR